MYELPTPHAMVPEGGTSCHAKGAKMSGISLSVA